MDTILGFFYLAVLVWLYFLPTFIAVLRGTHNIGPVAVINTTLGWTMIGWIVALAMSVTAHRQTLNPRV
jgi:hypothetical protein